jgi:hypothetical protein
MSNTISQRLVTRGLDPRVHTLRLDGKERVDRRVKPGDDGCGWGDSVTYTNDQSVILRCERSEPRRMNGRAVTLRGAQVRAPHQDDGIEKQQRQRIEA